MDAVGAGALGHGYRLGPRVPVEPRHVIEAVEAPTRVPRDAPSRVYARASSSSTSCDPANSNLCEKPASSQSLTLPIALGVGIPLAAALFVILYLHWRNVNRLKKEDQKDPHKSLDFGLVLDPAKGAKNKRKSAFFGAEKEGGAPTTRARQLSMDMNLSSPYLLPPGLQSSRESLHSLARTLHQNEDPYRPVAKYAASDVASMRSFPKEMRDGSSVYTGSSGQESGFNSGVNTRSMNSSTTLVAPPRQNSLPKTPPPPTSPLATHFTSNVREVPAPAPAAAPKEAVIPMEPTIPIIETVPYPDELPNAKSLDMPIPLVQQPPPVAQKDSRRGLPPSPKSSRETSPPPHPHLAQPPHEIEDSFVYDHHTAGYPEHAAQPMHMDQESNGLGLVSPQSQQASIHMSPSPINSVPEIPYIQESAVPPAPFSAPITEDAHGYYNDNYYPGQDQTRGQVDYHDNNQQVVHRRQSSEYHQDVPHGGLDVPHFDSKRMSVGFRPLPPDEMMETEDPETRANRIRSFYKEYFEDTKPGPNGYQEQQYGQQQANTQYSEDYDQQYLGEAAFFDPDSNAFVMPYAQPVSRRAMTPPPSGSRFPGPRGGPRGYHGSVGGMSLSGGRGPPRPGSSASSGRWGPRPGSSASNQWGQSRAGSSMSGRPGAPRRPMPPPTTLNTLPAPSKLKDDSFALMGAVDFAPPSTFRDQARGRSQSPLGERRPYRPGLPVSSPLVSSYDEMSALPSPHLLRKSGAFTGLDFAPPRRFKDGDNMSDAGSIRSNRSNRSGISAVHQQALRSGAGRVSRLPGDTVFTQAAMANELKPSWGMRP